MAENSCGCGSDAKIVLACSGASDVGGIADATGRRLSREGLGRMSCLSGVGAGVSGYVPSAQGACKLLVIDGCPVECGKKCVEKAGIGNFVHLRLAVLGLEKGKSPAEPGNLEKAYEAAKKLL